MRIIKRKTNVRQHDRRTKHKVADVRKHERNIRGKVVLGNVKLKDLKYPRAKRIFPTLEPYGDADDDGVINKKDCRPFDIERQDEEEDMMIRNMEAERTRQEEIERQQEEADQDISDILAAQRQKERGWSI